MQWVRGGHKVAWLNAWLSQKEPLDSVLSHIPDLGLLREIRTDGAVEAALMIAVPGDTPPALSQPMDQVTLTCGFRVDLLDDRQRILLALAPGDQGWIAERAGSSHRLTRDHLRHLSRTLDEVVIQIANETAALDLVGDRREVDQALDRLDRELSTFDWPASMTRERWSVLKKAARILVVLNVADRASSSVLSSSLHAQRYQALHQLGAPARRAAEAAFSLER